MSLVTAPKRMSPSWCGACRVYSSAQAQQNCCDQKSVAHIRAMPQPAWHCSVSLGTCGRRPVGQPRSATATSICEWRYPEVGGRRDGVEEQLDHVEGREHEPRQGCEGVEWRLQLHFRAVSWSVERSKPSRKANPRRAVGS